MLARIGLFGEAEHPRPRLGTDHEVDHTTEFAQFIEVVVRDQVVDMAGEALALHPAASHYETRGVGHHALLHIHLRPVGERGDHAHVLVPLFGKALLGGGRAVFVLQTLHIAEHAGDETHCLHLAIEVHLHAGLVAIDHGEDHTGLACLLVQDGPHRGIDLGVHEHHVLAVGDGLEGDGGTELHLPGDVDETVDEF